MSDNVYIFTEIVNCGKIGRIALDSFHKYHNHPVHVYGTKDDFVWINEHKNNIFIEVEADVLKGYERGHIGTALLWEKIIKACQSEILIHFDSDVIFRASIIGDMIEKSSVYDLIGPIRNYHHNPQKRIDISHLCDLCQTNCTLFKKSFISKKYLSTKTRPPLPSITDFITLPPIQIARRIKWYIKNTLLSKQPMSEMAQMIHGTYAPFSFPTLDFFDPIMFDMISNGAKIYHLDFDEVGGCNKYGKRDNVFKELNNFPTPYKLDFGSKLVHFSCVGSGMNFFHNPETMHNVGKEYVKAALDRYALFCKTFYNETLPGISVDQYEKIITLKEWY